MTLRTEHLKRDNRGEDFPEPDGELVEVLTYKVDRMTVLTRVEDRLDDAVAVEPEEVPTNDEGEPLCVGKDDGQCSRTVDEPGEVCWQHEPDDD